MRFATATHSQLRLAPLLCLLLLLGCGDRESGQAPQEIPVEKSFHRDLYRFANPDRKAEKTSSGENSELDHYRSKGQHAVRPDGEDYETFFVGTNSNDILRAFGHRTHAHLIGVPVDVRLDSNLPFPLLFPSTGKGQIDILIGSGTGKNEFILGSLTTSLNAVARPFYLGNGDHDKAIVRNFRSGHDSIVLSGKPSDYRFIPSKGAFHISTSDGDLVGVVQGITNLKVGEADPKLGFFTLH